MSASQLLDRLEGVRERGPAQWLAKCPAHEDQTPSLSIRETDDGTVLLKCFTGCGAGEVVAAVGLELSDLSPARPEAHSVRSTNKPRISGWDMLIVLQNRLTKVVIAAGDLSRNKLLSPADHKALLDTVADINEILECTRELT